jgi:hypothetical protein
MARPGSRDTGDIGVFPPLDPRNKANPSAVNTYPRVGAPPKVPYPHSEIIGGPISRAAEADTAKLNGELRGRMREYLTRARRD